LSNSYDNLLQIAIRMWVYFREFTVYKFLKAEIKFIERKNE